jgi:CheY-like chemotaxis protein
MKGNIKETIDFCIKIEDAAMRIYEKAASRFKDDKELADLLRKLADDERTHHDFIRKASELLKDDVNLPSLVSLDKEIKEQADRLFQLAENEVEIRRFTKEDLLKCMVSIECSEWNNIFLYVIKTLNRQFREFIPEAVNIQQHKRAIERFLESRPEYNVYLQNIKGLSPVWEERLLVVDDEEIIADLLTATLEDEGAVDSAKNGEKAIERLSERYYAAIITDVDMPVMNGVEFYKKAVEIFPTIKDRFLFFTSSVDDGPLSFFKENDLRYLEKPSTMKEVKNAVVSILSK